MSKNEAIVMWPSEGLWTLKETAAFFKKCPKTIMNWCERGFPYKALPCGRMFDPKEIHAWLHRRSFNSVNGAEGRNEDNEDSPIGNDDHAHIGLAPRR